jgi:hypothetical protein
MIKFGVIAMLILVSQAMLPAFVLPSVPPSPLSLEDATATSRSLATQLVPGVVIDSISIQDTIDFSQQLAIIGPGDQCYADINQPVLHESL